MGGIICDKIVLTSCSFLAGSSFLMYSSDLSGVVGFLKTILLFVRGEPETG